MYLFFKMIDNRSLWALCLIIICNNLWIFFSFLTRKLLFISTNVIHQSASIVPIWVHWAKICTNMVSIAIACFWHFFSNRNFCFYSGISIQVGSPIIVGEIWHVLPMIVTSVFVFNLWIITSSSVCTPLLQGAIFSL